MKIKKRLKGVCFMLLVCCKIQTVCAQPAMPAGPDSIFNKEKYLYEGILQIIGEAHYAPPPITDTLSAEIFEGFLKKLDPSKNIFLQSDINALSKYKYSIADEMNGTNTLAFYSACKKIYLSRISGLRNYPLFKRAENWQPLASTNAIPEADSISWATSIAEQQHRWDEQMTYQYLLKLNDLQKAGKSAEERSTKAKMALNKKYNHWLDDNTNDFSETNFFAGYINVLCAVLDPHTEYQPPVNKQKFDQMMSNAFYGIGVQLGFNDQMDVIIKSVMKGTAAWKSGEVANGSALLAVAQGSDKIWQETDGRDITEIVGQIRGAEGTEVRLKIKDEKNGNIRDVTLKREKVSLKQAGARSAIVENANGKRVGILYLPEFYNDFAHSDGAKSAADVAAELKRLDSAHINCLLVDLRNNGGGSVTDAVKIAGYFIPSGPVVQVRNSSGKVNAMVDDDTSVLYNGPMAVLVNAQSASASEIFTAAMQDYKRAVVIGTNTYGKGTVQRQLPLGENKNGEPQYGAIKLTFQKFYRVSGATTQKIGVKPDIFLPDLYNYFTGREDNQPYALKADSVPPANFTTYTGSAAAFIPKSLSFNYRNDSILVKIDKLEKEIARPVVKWTNTDSIKKQYELNKTRADSLKQLETLPANKQLKVVALGSYQDEIWYKDWLNALKSSKEFSDAISIFK